MITGLRLNSICKRARLLGLVLMAIVVGFATFASAVSQYPLADRIPADVGMYEAYSGRTVAFDGSYAGQFLAEMNLERVLSAAVKAVGVEVFGNSNSPIPASAAELVKIVIKRPAAIFTSGSEMSMSEPASMVITLMIDLGGDKQAFMDNYSVLEALIVQQAGASVKKGNVASGSFSVLSGIGLMPEIYIGTMGDMFIVTVDPAMIETIDSLDKSPEKSLANNPAFLKSLSSISNKDIVSVSYSSAKSQVNGLLQQQGMHTQPFMEILDLIGLGNLGQLVTVNSVVDRRIFTQSKIYTPAPHKGVLKLLDPEIEPACRVDDIPADSNFACVATINPVGALNELRRIMAMQNPQAASQLEQALQAASGFVGMSVEEKLLANMGPRVVVANSPSVGGLMGLMFMVDLKDQLTFAKALAQLEGIAMGISQNQLQRSGTQPFVLLKERAGDTYMTIFKFANGWPVPVNPTWAIHDGKLIIGLWPQTVKTILTGEIEMGLDKNKKFQRAHGMLNGSPHILVYGNNEFYYRQLYFVAEAISSAVTNALGKYDIELSPTWMPTLASFEKLPADGVIGIWSENDGLVYESCGAAHTLPVYAAGIGCSTAVLLPSLARAKGLARLSASKASLRAIAQANAIYVSENGGKPAESLEVLGEEVGLDRKLWVSPYSGERYIYHPLDYMAPSNLIVAYDPKPTNDLKYAVVFNDCHVEMIGQDEFYERLVATKNYLDRNR